MEAVCIMKEVKPDQGGGARRQGQGRRLLGPGEEDDERLEVPAVARSEYDKDNIKPEVIIKKIRQVHRQPRLRAPRRSPRRRRRRTGLCCGCARWRCTTASPRWSRRSGEALAEAEAEYAEMTALLAEKRRAQLKGGGQARRRCRSSSRRRPPRRTISRSRSTTRHQARPRARS